MKFATLSPVSTVEDSSTPAERSFNEAALIIPFLIIVAGLKLGLSFWLHSTHFLEYDADGFTRSVRAWEWHTGATQLEVDAWLPLQFWLNGWLMGFWANLLYVPRLVNLICSMGTTVNLFLIGRHLFGRRTGYLSGLLAAIFPWEIWFGLSGMSESLTNLFLSGALAAFCYWLAAKEPVKVRWLVVSSLGFLGATMVRYEAWFYSSLYALVVLAVLWQRRNGLKWQNFLRTGLAVVPAFLFIPFWMYLSWVDPRLQSPLGFAKLTSDINKQIYGAANNNASLLYKLFFYPQTFLNLLPVLTVPVILGSLWLAWRPVGSVRFYLGLVWGEFALFILTTLPYNNIAPGSARYPVSNLLLLLPVAAWLLDLLISQPRPVLRYSGVALFVALGLVLGWTTLTRAPAFPDGDTRQVANFLNQRWKDGYIQPGEQVYLIVPSYEGAQASDYTLAYYSLKVLTNHPDSFIVESDPQKFTQVLQKNNGLEPRLWIRLDSAGGDLDKLTANYREIKTFGRYTVGDYPLFGLASAQLETGVAQPTFAFKANEYGSKETLTAWVSRPDGKTINLGNKQADEQGQIAFNYTIAPGDLLSGKWSLTIVGMESGRRTTTLFDVPGQ